MGIYLAVESAKGTSYRITTPRTSVCSLGVTLHHVPDVPSTLDVGNGHASDARSVLAARLALVGTGVAINLGADSHWDCRQVGVPRGNDSTTWVAEKLSLGVVRRTSDEFTAVREHNHTTLGVEEDGRCGHFRIEREKNQRRCSYSRRARRSGHHPGR